MTENKHEFKAEVTRLLDIVTHSLYSHREIFLRELISNGADACDRLRFLALQNPDLTAGDGDFAIRVAIDKEERTVTVTDNGIGMDKDDLIDQLGTIARSGTADFIHHHKENGGDSEAVGLIGQFGIGFYAAFMVSEKVEVTSRKAGSDAANVWCSQGDGAFTVEKCEQGPARGTKIQLFLRDDAEEFLDEARLTSIVKAYSDHIAIPVIVGSSEDSANSASALWTRPKSEISEDQYREFYHHCAHSFDEPWLTMHWKGEGVIDYTALLFIPTLKPFDLYDPRRLTRLRLYVRRIFITDNAENLLPAWLRFLRGVIDSIDLPLSVSREMLQHNPVMTKIRTRVTKKVLGELGKLAKNDPDRYAGFWEAFGAVVKEGLYEDAGLRADIFKIARFRSTKADGWTSLADYVGRMKDGQKAIYFVSGEDEALLKASPQLEGFAARDIEVLLLTDSIDEFWMPVVESFEDKPFKSITRAGADLAAFAEKDKPSVVARDEDADNASALIGLIKTVLGPAIKDVRVSHVLVDSPVCLSVDTGDVDFHMERMLKQHKQLDLSIPRILEVNPAHHLIRELNGRVEKEGQNASLENIAWLLLDQARILEGEPLPDPAAFGRRLTHVLEGAVKKDHQDTKYAKKH